MYMRLAMLAVLLGLSGRADAASRMIVTVDGVFNVSLDAVSVVGAGTMGRTTISVTPGRHLLQVRDTAGLAVYSATIEVPDNASVTAHWDGTAMKLVGAHEASSLTVEADTPFKAEGDVPEAEDRAALDAANDQDDKNQVASAHGQRAQTDNHAVGGRIPTEVTDAVGQTATSGLGVSANTANLAYAAAGSFAYMVQTAEAGGIRKRYSPDARQGNPNAPPPVLEDVKLVNVGGKPMSVYVDGMWLHDFEPGQTEKTFQIEVGSRQLQFVDPAKKAIVHQGSLRIKEDFVLVLEFSPTSPPKATNANWAWASQ